MRYLRGPGENFSDVILRLNGRGGLAFEAAPAWIVSGAVARDRPPHDDEAGRLKFSGQASFGPHFPPF
jgi:hypothetical protein